MNLHPMKAIRRWLPLTYPPKIPGVLNGTITQTIRIDTDLMIGDWIAFHGWTGRPYRSPWSFRTPYLYVKIAEPIQILEFDAGIYWESTGIIMELGDPALDTLAKMDGIQPATGAELIRLLREMHGPGFLKGKVIQWDPEPLGDPNYCHQIAGYYKIAEEQRRAVPASSP